MIFTTLATTDRAAALVTEDYLQGSRLDAATEQSIYLTKAEQYLDISLSARAALSTTSFDALLEQIRMGLTNLTRLSPTECRNAYSSLQTPFNFSNVLLISFSNISNTLDGFIDCELHYPETIIITSIRTYKISTGSIPTALLPSSTNTASTQISILEMATSGTFLYGIITAQQHHILLSTALLKYSSPSVVWMLILESSLVSSLACLWNLGAWLVWLQADSGLLVRHGIHLPYTLS